MDVYYKQRTGIMDLLLKRMDLVIETVKKDNKKLMLFGISKITRIMLYYIRKSGCSVSCILDNSSTTDTEVFMGVKVADPKRRLQDFDDDVLVLIVSAHQNAMIKQLESLGYQYGKHILKIIDLSETLNDYSFTDRNGLSELSDDEIRQSQIGILKHIKETCEENGIWYSLAYGTVLGAVRHKGYIPWDDDIDLYIMPEDLDRLAELINDKRYQLIYTKNCPESYTHMGYVVDRHTILDYNVFIPQSATGVAVDLFFLYGQPDEPQYENYFNHTMHLETEKWLAYKDKTLCRQISNELSEYLNAYSLKDNIYIGNVQSPYYKKDHFPKSLFLTREKLLFEDELYYVMGGYKKYLEIIYGDFMRLPPLSMQVRRHSYRAYKNPAGGEQNFL